MESLCNDLNPATGTPASGPVLWCLLDHEEEDEEEAVLYGGEERKS